MGLEIRGTQPVTAKKVYSSRVAPRFAGNPKETETGRPGITLSGLIGGFGKLLAKGHFGVISAFLNYRQDLLRMRNTLNKVDFRTEPGGITSAVPSEVKLNNALMGEFAGALHNGAAGLLKLFAAQGMNPDNISFRDGLLQTMKNFGTPIMDDLAERRYFMQPAVGPEVPIYAMGLDELEARCKTQGITPVKGTLEEAFTLMRKAAMPSSKLADAIAIMKDVESRF